MGRKGRIWNTKPCRCIDCNEEFKSITDGLVHGNHDHKYNWAEARRHLKEVKVNGD